MANKLAQELNTEAHAELATIATRRERRQLIAAVAMTVGEYLGALYLLWHEADYISLYLAVTYYVRETKGGAKYHAAFVAFITRKARCIKGNQS